MATSDVPKVAGIITWRQLKTENDTAP